MSIKIKQNNYVSFGARLEKNLDDKLNIFLSILHEKFNAKISKNQLINEILDYGIKNVSFNINDIDYSMNDILEFNRKEKEKKEKEKDNFFIYKTPSNGESTLVNVKDLQANVVEETNDN